MRRRLLKLGLLLVAGAIISVAVVIAVSLFIRHVEWNPDETVLDLKDDHGNFRWEGSVSRMATMVIAHSKRHRWPEHSFEYDVGSPSYPIWAHELLTPTPEFVNGTLRIDQRVIVARGWPCVAMSFLVFGDNNPNWNTKHALTIGNPFENRGLMPRSIPLLPIWPGFAINTVFYAAIVWLLFFAPFKLRRWWGARRIKRGLCPACAYPVGTNSRCTECGKPVKVT